MGGSTIATIQTISSVSQGALSLSLIRLQIVGEVSQIMRFIDIQWPPNVAEYHSLSHIDPTSIMLPIDFTTWWNDQLADRNYSLPRIYEEYEIPLFFSENYPMRCRIFCCIFQLLSAVQSCLISSRRHSEKWQIGWNFQKPTLERSFVTITFCSFIDWVG